MGRITSSVYTKINNIIGKRSTVTLYANTDTYDPITRSRSDSFSAGTTISGIFLRRNALITLFEEGALEEGDAYLLVDKSITINRHDKVTVDSVNYLVDDTIIRYWGDNQLFLSCKLTFLGSA